MASITIRNLGDDVKTRLRVRAAEHHRNLAAFTHECFAPLGGVEFELPARRGPMREPPDFS